MVSVWLAISQRDRRLRGSSRSAGTGVHRPLRCSHHRVHQGFEVLERRSCIVGIERWLIEVGAELDGEVVVRLVRVTIAAIAVEAKVMEEVVALKLAVVSHHPMKVLVHERAQDGGGHLLMVIGAERVTDVVQERAQHVVITASRLFGSVSSLQRMSKSVDRVAAIVTTEEPEVVE